MEYELAAGAPLTRASAHASRDPLAGRPLAQARRRALVAAELGDDPAVAWETLVCGDLGPFVSAFVMYVSCV